MNQMIKRWTVFFAGLAVLVLPTAAQQEVSPDHFDEKPSAARSHKPALPTRNTTTTRNNKSANHRGSTAAKARSEARASFVLKADATTSSNSR